MLVVAIYGLLSTCNVSIIESYFTDGTPAKTCFTGNGCYSDSNNLVASYSPVNNAIISLTSSKYINYNVFSSYSDDSPTYVSCMNVNTKTYVCEGKSNSIKIKTQYIWDIQTININTECIANERIQGANNSDFIIIIVISTTIVLIVIVIYTRWLQLRIRKKSNQHQIVSSSNAPSIFINANDAERSMNPTINYSNRRSSRHKNTHRGEKIQHNKTFTPSFTGSDIQQTINGSKQNKPIPPRDRAPLRERPTISQTTVNFNNRFPTENYERSKSAEPFRHTRENTTQSLGRSNSVRSSRSNSRPRSSHRLGTRTTLGSSK